MGLKGDLEAEVKKIFGDRWTTREGQVVPASEDIKLGNDAVTLDATVLYADMSQSTALVDQRKAHFAAEVYKTYLHCAAKIIASEDGVITAYDGDRIMAVFIGKSKNTSAVRTALKINWARINIVNPKLKAQYPDADYTVKHTVGVDTSSLWVARTGIRGSNDLVWVGRAANHAAKLCDLGPDPASWISADVFNNMHDSVKTTDGKSMWAQYTWNAMDGRAIYASTWMWAVP